MTCGRQFQVKRSRDDKLLLALKIDLITSRAFERVGSYHTRPENRVNDFEKVYPKSFESFWLANARSGRTTQSWKISKARKLLTSTDELFSSVFASWGFVCVRASLVLRRGFGSGSALVTSSTVNKAKSASLANKALLCRSSSPNRTLFEYLSSFNFCRALYYDRALQIVSYISFWSRKVSPNLKNFLCQRFVAFRAVSANSSQVVVSRKHISKKKLQTLTRFCLLFPWK